MDSGAIGGISADEQYMIRDGRLESVSLGFSVDNCKAGIRALIETYGQPTSHVERTFRKGLFREWRKEMLDWHGSRVTLSVEREIGKPWCTAVFSVKDCAE